MYKGGALSVQADVADNNRPFDASSGPGSRWRSRERTGGEPLWIVPKGPRSIFLGVCTATNFVKQAAPANDVALVCLLVLK